MYLVQHGSGMCCRQTEASSGLCDRRGWKADYHYPDFPLQHFPSKSPGQHQKIETISFYAQRYTEDWREKGPAKCGCYGLFISFKEVSFLTFLISAFKTRSTRIVSPVSFRTIASSSVFNWCVAGLCLGQKIK